MYSRVFYISIRHLDLDKGFLSVCTNESQQRHSVCCPNPVRNNLLADFTQGLSFSPHCKIPGRSI